MDISPSPFLSRPTRFPYIIYVTDYSELSSGVKALHLLCHALNRAGCEAYVMSGVTDPHLQTPTISLLRRDSLRNAGRLPIVLYPEIVSGNPLEEAVVARWLLNRPGRFIGDSAGSFGPRDMVFYHDAEFMIDGVSGTSLHMPVCDLSIYNNANNPHDGERKGHVLFLSRFLKTGEPIPSFLDDAVIVSMDNPRTPRELAELYRRSEMLFTFERTAATLEANMCGCPVVYLESSLMPEMPSQHLFGNAGAAWGFIPEEVARATATLGQVGQIYQQQMTNFEVELRRFIERTQGHAAHIWAHIEAHRAAVASAEKPVTSPVA